MYQCFGLVRHKLDPLNGRNQVKRLDTHPHCFILNPLSYIVLKKVYYPNRYINFDMGAAILDLIGHSYSRTIIVLDIENPYLSVSPEFLFHNERN